MRDIAISALVSIFIAGITGWISAKQAYRREIRKSVYEKRQELYIEIFELFEKLQNNPYLVYNYEQFIQPFNQIKARTNLYASRKVLKILTPFNKRIKELWNKYYNLFESENALEELQNRQYEAELGGNVSDDQVEWKFQLEADMYEEKNLISGEEIADVLERLSKQVREELKTER